MKISIILITLISFITIFTITKKNEKEINIKNFKYVSPIKKQMWGTCWAFSTIASLESNILKNKVSHTADLSEYHLDKYNGFNRDGKEGDPRQEWFSTQGKGFKGSNIDSPAHGVMVHLGGDYSVAASYLSGTLGAVEESKTPNLSKNSPFKDFGNTSTTGVRIENNYRYVYPKKIQWITTAGSDGEKRLNVKAAIKRYGSVASSQYMESSPFTHINEAEVHLNTNNISPNHAITLVGWDDDIKIKNYIGAWIVKDSDHIDEKTGEKIGLFYIPYDDIVTAKDEKLGGVVFGDVAIRDKNTKIYNHALHGWQYDFHNEKSIKNVYKIKSSERIQAVGVYTPRSSDDILVDIYVNNKLLAQTKYHARFPGFYYLDFENINVNFNDTVEIVQKNTSNSYSLDSSFWLNVLLSGEDPELKPQWIESRASKGESFYLKNEKWLDLTEKFDKNSQVIFKNANFPIILYTNTHER